MYFRPAGCPQGLLDDYNTLMNRTDASGMSHLYLEILHMYFHIRYIMRFFKNLIYQNPKTLCLQIDTDRYRLIVP